MLIERKTVGSVQNQWLNYQMELFKFMRANQMAEVENLINTQPINKLLKLIDDHGNSILHVSCDKIEMFQLIITRYGQVINLGDIALQNNYGHTILMLAVYYGQADLVALCLSQQYFSLDFITQSINSLDHEGTSVLFYAVSHKPNIFEMLIKTELLSEQTINTVTKYGVTILHKACLHTYIYCLEIVKIILNLPQLTDETINSNECRINGWNNLSAISLAVQNNLTEIIRYMLECKDYSLHRFVLQFDLNISHEPLLIEPVILENKTKHPTIKTIIQAYREAQNYSCLIKSAYR